MNIKKEFCLLYLNDILSVMNLKDKVEIDIHELEEDVVAITSKYKEFKFYVVIPLDESEEQIKKRLNILLVNIETSVLVDKLRIKI